MKHILILILVFVLVVSFPCVASAEDIYEEETEPVGTIVNTPILYGGTSLQIYTLDWLELYNSNYQVGSDVNVSYPTTNGFIYRFSFSISSYLTEQQKYLLKSSVYTTLFIESTIDFYSDPSFSSQDFEMYMYYDLDNKSPAESYLGVFTQQPTNSIFEIDFGEYFYGSNLEYFTVYYLSYFRDYGDRLVDMQYSVADLTLTLRTVGADKSTADIVINLDNINNSINQGFDQMGDKLDGVQGSINQGFDQMGNKLDDVQDSVNQGFSGILTPDSDDQHAVDQMGNQVNNNKQEAENIKDQINGLDKPDPDDLLNQINPDQFVDKEDDAVQEMTGILASITGSKVVKNYLLLLLGIGIVSFVVYGKKGG